VQYQDEDGWGDKVCTVINATPHMDNLISMADDLMPTFNEGIGQ
jgi:hypothetical protein